MKVQANGIEMNYDLAGEGECVVLIHGFSDNMNMWFGQVGEFSQKHRVLTYDVRGFGETERADAVYSMELFADDLRELMRALGIERACVLGYSMGGRIALEFALKYPEMTTGIIFANSGIGDAPKPDMVERRKMMAGVLEQGDINMIAEIMTVASFSPDFGQRDPDMFAKYKEIKLQNDPADYLKVMQVLVDALDNPPDLAQLTCPTLIIAGDQDGLMEPEAVDHMKSAIADAEAVMLPTGHAAAIEMPEEFNKAVTDFLARL
jgi:pimeloyl-ACP methyl ester carboxylesterase